MLFAINALGQSEQRGSTPPGQAQDGSKPSEGAIQGGTILPGETSGIPDGKAQSRPTERAARCLELQGTLREECLAQEKRAGTGGTAAPDVRDIPPSPPLTAPPQNPR
jgi:hypothetical protein